MGALLDTLIKDLKNYHLIENIIMTENNHTI